MKITFEFDENDFLNFQSYFRRVELISWLIVEMIIIGVGFTVGGIFYWYSTNLLISILLIIMSGLLLNLLMFILLWSLIVTKLISARRGKAFGVIDITVTERGFHIFHHQFGKAKKDYRGYFQTWSEVKKLRESKDYFFLVMTLGREIVIPKRAFSSEQEVTRFRQEVITLI